MTVELRGGAYAASRIGSTLKGSTKQFVAYPATIRIDSPPYRNIIEAPTVGHREERDSVYLPKVPK